MSMTEATTGYVDGDTLYPSDDVLDEVPREFIPFSEAASDRVSALRDRIDAYDPVAPEAAHLRGHQIYAIQRFRDTSKAILSGNLSNEGMALLHPTGAGKTVTTAEMARMLCAEVDQGTEPQRVLMLVPGHQILRQTTGDEDELGAIRTFASGVTVAEYSGKRKQRGALVTVMTYQALAWAIERGDVDAIDPSIVICDEAHHIIDGTWAQAVEQITPDRLLLGLTATPAYSVSRDVRRLFPHVLDRRTMKDGISEGMLSNMQGFLYKGTSRLHISRYGADFSEEDMFSALAESEDNYLAAKICAREVEMGRRGVVSCVPGFDRAHAKIVAEILNNTTIKTPDGGERKIKAAFVGGEIHERALEEIFEGYRKGEIDVITYVNLLLEGWDSPETDFSVLLRPTLSRVLAEQRIGRTIRPRPDKIATVHEIMYEMSDDAPQQVTHLDILDEDKVTQGHYYGVKRGENAQKHKKNYRQQGPVHIFDINNFTVDPDLAARLAQLDDAPLEEVRILCGQESVPFEWHTSHILARKFDLTREDVETILENGDVPFRSEESEGISRVYYPPRASLVIAEHLGLGEMPEDAMVMTYLMKFWRGFQQYNRVTRGTIERALEEAGITPTLFITTSGNVVRAYPPESIDVPPVSTKDHRPSKVGKRIVEISEALSESAAEVLGWLDKVLVNPAHAESHIERTDIKTAQSALIAAIGKLGSIDPELYKEMAAEVKKAKLKPTDQMTNVMNAKKLDFVGLIMAAGNARNLIKKMEARKSRRS